MLGGKPVSFATDKARALLAYLAVEADHPHRREALAGLLWPDQPEAKARHSLRQALSHLRQAIGDCPQQPYLLVTRDTVQFDPACDYRLDTAAFSSLVQECARHPHRRVGACYPCLRRMEQMTGLYRGDFLEQFFISDSSAFEEWALLKREWLRLQLVQVLTNLAEYYEQRGELDRAREYVRKQVRLEPWHEEAHRQLMRLLALDGQRSAALAQYETCHQAMTKELGAEPAPATVALYGKIRAGTLEHPKPLHNLPAFPTTFVGREKELAELAELLANPACRLVTLVGPGGIGKTRLALQAASNQIGVFSHGVYFAPLADVHSTDLLILAIANALRLQFSGSQAPKEQLQSHLRQRELLLVLDNMEYLLKASPILTELLNCAPGLTLLATSRERLNLQEEWVYQLDGLTYPSPLLPLPSSLAPTTYTAIDLFQQRALQVQRQFSLEEQAPAVIRIVQLVEGLPLGIELSAAWVGIRPCAEIAQELERALDILASSLRNVPKRQQSIRATFEYSWRLLSEPERQVLAGLSVFKGGFTQSAAAPVANASPDLLTALCQKSLLRCEADGRFYLHHLLQQYAAEKLGEAQQAQAARARHAHYHAAFLQQREQALQGPGQKEAAEAIAADIENVHAAWQWAITQENYELIEAPIGSLYYFYDMRSWFQQAHQIFEQLVQTLQAAGGAPERLLGQALVRLGGISFRLGLYKAARELLQQGIAILDRLGDQTELAFALIALGHVALYQHGHDEARQCYETSLALHTQQDNQPGLAEALNSLGVVLRERGQYAEARQALEQALDIGKKLGNRWRVSFFLNNLGIVARMMGDYAQAGQCYQESLALKQEFGDLRGAAISLNNLGNIATAIGELDEAQRLHQESLKICQDIGDQLGIARSLNNLGMVAHTLGEYKKAKQLHQQSLAIKQEIGDQRGAVHSLKHLGKADAELGHYQPARQHLRQALQQATELKATPLALDILKEIAELMAKEGNPHRAIQLLALVRHHPSGEQATQDQAGQLLDSLSSQLSPQERAAAEQAGSSQSLETIVAELTRPLTPPPDHAKIAP